MNRGKLITNVRKLVTNGGELSTNRENPVMNIKLVKAFFHI
jgi:hypothetical protein